MAHRYMMGGPTDGGKAHIPTLKVQQHDQLIQEAVLKKAGSFRRPSSLGSSM